MNDTWFLIWRHDFCKKFIVSCAVLFFRWVTFVSIKNTGPQVRNDAANEMLSLDWELYDLPLYHHQLFAVDECGFVVHPGGSCTELG